ncbi:MAG TPA: aminotransferase class I/II-fold pyridoxal phosphate-dependent enzyme [Acidobacteriaceae bacterium]|jgi:glutamate/tyrosine decarboxylase-like PLP-dependent enzyme
MADDLSLDLLSRSLPILKKAFGSLPKLADQSKLVDEPKLLNEFDPGFEQMAAVLDRVAGRMADNYPYFHPLYAGQMLKPPHPLARAAYALAMWINPNNHALDGGRASSRMEVEAVRAIARMFGWTDFLGHLTSSGTFANLEALWIAGRLAPGKRVVASEEAHYTHRRISEVLGLPFISVATDARGRMDPAALEAIFAEGDVGTVVVTLGATATGAVDPLHQLLAFRDRFFFRIHVDAAYGGYFTLADNLAEDTAQAFASIAQADSIVVDPHKHGLQPYGCGCVLFRDPSVGRFYKHDSPYTYFSSEELHLGEISLECSRAGASAVALWATQELLPLTREGEFAASLCRCRQAALELHQRIRADRRFVSPFRPELDIVVWAVRSPSIAESSDRAQRIFAEAALRDLHLALVQLPVAFFPPWSDQNQNGPTAVTCLRSVLMKPEHLDWLDVLWDRLSIATDRVLAGLPRA